MLVVLAIFWVAERSLFPVFLVVSVMWVVAEHVRRRRAVPSAPPAIAAEAARLLQSTRRTRRGAWIVPMAGGEVRVGQGSLPGQIAGDATFLTLSVPIGRRIPFCFAIRPEHPPVRWMHMVENTPISGVDFEYQLRAVPVAERVEAASNHPKLLGDWLHGETLRTVLVLGEAPTPGFQGLLFDGQRLVSLWTWTGPPPGAVLRLAAMRTLLLAGELDTLLSEVQFNQPL